MSKAPGTVTTGNEVEVFRGGKTFFYRLFEQIDAAKTFIHIQVYILGNDATGHKLLDHLFAAAARGVKVFLMLDAYGSSWVDKSTEEQWRKKGIQIKLFSRLMNFKRFFIGRRQHAKIVVIDAQWMSVGGLNFANRYSGFDNKEPWLDVACWVKGPAAARLNELAAGYWPHKVKRYLRSQKGDHTSGPGISIQILMNDWLRKRVDVKNAYFEAFQDAKEEIVIAAAYFFPSRKLLRLLRKKAKEGVKILLVFSAESDVPFVKASMEYFYAGLQREGMEIREWKASMLHAKVAFVDKKWVTLGSYNLNQLSDFGSLETNIAFEDDKSVGELYAYFFKEIHPKTELVSLHSGAWVRQIERLVSFLLIRIALNVLFLTNRHPH